jgi:hypothetical protein
VSGPSVDTVLDAGRALCTRAGVDLIMPGDPRREAVVYALGAWHKLRGGDASWDVGYARENVSVTVPTLGPALALLSAIPVAGEVFRALGSAAARPAIYLATGAMRDGATCAGVLSHELGHVARLTQGGLLWCVAYGAAPEARAADEAACYGMDIAARVVLAGDDPDLAADAALRSLGRYDLDVQSTELARAIVGVHRRSLAGGGLPGGPIVGLLRELEDRGVELPERWRLPAGGGL